MKLEILYHLINKVIMVILKIEIQLYIELKGKLKYAFEKNNNFLIIYF